jgi:rhodanese-related sulfurtransferase
MRDNKWTRLVLMLLLIGGAQAGSLGPELVSATGHGPPTKYIHSESAYLATVAVNFITVDELKTKVAKNQPVTVIDVRSSTALLSSGVKIKGAFYVKLRRLRYRLAFPPFKDIPRDSEVVTYCSCPNDEAALRAAELLLDAGFKNVRVLKGGFREWQKAKGPLEQQPRGM